MSAMPNELTIPAVQAAAASAESPAGTKAAASAPAGPPPTHFLTNPSLRLDPALGLVVIEFRNDSGAVTHSIPSQRQIDAYRLHEQTPPGPDGPPPEET
jgi:hypothetical protein